MSGYLTGWQSGGNAPENQMGVYSVGVLDLDEAAIGGQNVTGIAASGVMGVNFTVDPVTYEVTADAPFDHELDSFVSLSIVIELDGIPQATDALNLLISNVNEAPTALTTTNGNIAEDAPAQSVIATLEGSDPDDGDALSFALVAPSTRFEIVGNELRLLAGAALDFETEPSLDLDIRVTDGGGLSHVQTFTITVADGNDAPTDIALDTATVAEDAAAGTLVGTLSGTDPNLGDALSFALVAPSTRFEIVGNELRLLAGAALDFETEPSLDLDIRVTDGGGLSHVQTFTITVADGNDAPTGIALDTATVAEDAAAGTLVGTLSGTDPDAGDALSFELAEPSSLFEIQGDQLLVAASASFDFETAGSHDVRVRVTDANGLTYERVLTINITDVNEAPFDPSLSSLQVREGAAAGTVIGTLAATDPEGRALTYTLLAGDGLEIVGNELRVVDGSLLSHANAPFPTIDIEVADDGGNTILFQPVLEVGAPNLAPQDLFLSSDLIAEDIGPGALVAELTVDDPDSSEFTFELLSGTGFAISGSNLVVDDGASFDFETGPHVDVEIRVTDSLGASQVFTRTIHITDVDEAPVDPALTGDTVEEGAAAGTQVGSFSALDPEGGAVGYQLVDDAAFYVDGDGLFVADGALLDHEGQAQRTVEVIAFDEAGNQRQFSVVVNITNADEAPGGLTLVHPSDPGLPPALPEDAQPGLVVALLQGSDPEGGPLTYTLHEGAGFIIDGDQLIFDGSVPYDHETMTSIQLVISVTDGAGNETFFEPMLAIANANEEPTELSIEGGSIDEDAPAGTVAAIFETTDPDSGDTFTYALDEPSDLFEVVGNELRLREGVTLDAEVAGTHDISVTATDAGGLTISRQFTITITNANVNAAPFGLAISALDVVENAAAGTVIGEISANDPDHGDGLTFTLAAASSLFEVVGNELRVKSGAVLDFETAASHDLRLRVTDGGGLSSELDVTVDVTDVNEAPIIAASLGVSELRIAENAPAGRQVGAVTVSDPDGGLAPSLSLVGEHASYFTLDGNQIRLAEDASLDFETLQTLSFGVRATDAGGLHATQNFTVNVIDVLESGTIDQSLPGISGFSGLQVRFEDSFAVITLGGNTIMVPDDGQLNLPDGTLSFGTDTQVAALERLYLSGLGRGSDGGGRMDYMDYLEEGYTLSNIAQFILDSPEFNGYVGSVVPGVSSYAEVSNAQFVTLLYDRVLGRAPDGDGYAFWLNGLDTGAISRADMLVGFTQSDEARDRFETQTQGLWVVDRDAMLVRSLYDVAFGREPDEGGLDYWVDLVEAGVSLGQVADAFVNSVEFQNQIAGLSTSQIIQQFYLNGLERPAEDQGLFYWVDQVDSGSLDFGDVMVMFAQSLEQQSQLQDYRDGVGIFGIV